MFDGLELRCCENLLGIAVAPQIEPKTVSRLVITVAVKQVLGLDHHFFLRKYGYRLGNQLCPHSSC